MVPVEEEENAATPPAASEACSGLAEQEERAPTTSASQHGECAAPTVEIVISPWEQSYVMYDFVTTFFLSEIVINPFITT